MNRTFASTKLEGSGDADQCIGEPRQASLEPH